MSNAIELLAHRAASFIPGIDWEALGGSPEEAVFSTAYIYDYMYPAFERYKEVKKDLGWTGVAFLDAADTLDKDTLARALAVKQMVLQDPLTVDEALTRPPAAKINPVYLKGDDFRYFLSFAVIDANDVLYMHTKHEGQEAPMMHMLAAAGELSPRELARSADACVRTYNAIHYLWKSGLLNGLRKPKGTAGVGIVVEPGVVIAGVIAVAVVALVVVIGLLLLMWKEQSKIIAHAKAACKKAIDTGDPKYVKLCKDLNSLNPASGVFDEASRAFGTVTQIALWVILGYGALLAAPYVMRGVGEARRAYREA